MAGTFTTVDLSKLPLPAVVEVLDFETIFAAMLADFQARVIASGGTYTALVESDPAYKVLEAASYRELLLRQRVNDAIRGILLAYAVSNDLDQVGANFNVQRLLVDAGDPDAVPPVAPTYEADEDFRRRIQLSFEGFTTAGSEGSYVFHALSADANVKDVGVDSPTPGAVVVTVLARDGDGTADADLLAAVNAALSAEDVRPLTDEVTVQSATITNFTVVAELTLYPGPDADVVRQAAQDAVEAYVDTIRSIGLDVARSGLFAALHQAGVQSVALTTPAADISVDNAHAPFCTAITITVNTARNE